jgi:GTPase SAR1 family protein
MCHPLSLSELMFLETSALTGENVEEAFVQCARKILNKIESGKDIPGQRLFGSPLGSVVCVTFSV